MLPKKSSIKKKIFLITIVPLIIIFSFQRLSIKSVGTLEEVSSYIMYPIVETGKIVSDNVHSFFDIFDSTEKLQLQLEKTRKENEELLSENILLKSSIAYLEPLSEMIEYKARYNQNYSHGIVAQITMKQFSDQEHYCIIDKGSCEGIRKDMVAVYKNCLIGRVLQVYPIYSKVQLITDKSCKVSAYCCKSGTVGIYQGLNQIDKATLNYVSHLDTVYEDDLVMSSGEGTIFPQGFALGKISSFSKDNVQYKIVVKPIIDLNSLNSCYIIAK